MIFSDSNARSQCNGPNELNDFFDIEELGPVLQNFFSFIDASDQYARVDYWIV
jgi:hypothetical protein